LNVSRSYLQGDPNVKKINSYISRKVGDKLQELYRDQKEDFISKWPSMEVFVKFGMITDEKFYEKAKEFCLYTDLKGKSEDWDTFRESIAASQTDKNQQLVVLYASDPEAQYSFIRPLEEEGYRVLKADSIIDQHFVHHMEMKLEKVSFKRVDADTPDKLIEKTDAPEMVLSDEEQNTLKTLFGALEGGKSLHIMIQSMSPNSSPLVVTQNEFMRRMTEMQSMGNFGGLGNRFDLVVNGNHALIQKLLKMNGDAQKAEAQQMLDLSLLSRQLLKGEQLAAFVQRNFKTLEVGETTAPMA